MRALVWIVEETWEATVTQAAAFLPLDAEITLLHVSPEDVDAVAAGARHGLLGRRRHPPPPPPHPRRAEPIAPDAQEALLADARERLGRPAEMVARRGRVEHEVIEAATGADVLIVARDGDHPGPKSIGHPTRFVVDHAPCPLLLIWPD
jgi:nucleotide-binding universal stress UspA family protein